MCTLGTNDSLEVNTVAAPLTPTPGQTIIAIGDIDDRAQRSPRAPRRLGFRPVGRHQPLKAIGFLFFVLLQGIDKQLHLVHGGLPGCKGRHHVIETLDQIIEPLAQLIVVARSTLSYQIDVRGRPGSTSPRVDQPSGPHWQSARASDLAKGASALPSHRNVEFQVGRPAASNVEPGQCCYPVHDLPTAMYGRRPGTSSWFQDSSLPRSGQSDGSVAVPCGPPRKESNGYANDKAST